MQPPEDLTPAIRDEALRRGLDRAFETSPGDVLVAWTSAMAHRALLPDDIPVEAEPWTGPGTNAGGAGE